MILEHYLEAGFNSTRALGIALARAKGTAAGSGVRDIRRFTAANPKKPPKMTERTALALANLLKIDPLELEPFLTRRAGADVDRMDDLEERIDRLERLLGEIRLELRGQRGDAPPGQSGSA